MKRTNKKHFSIIAAAIACTCTLSMSAVGAFAAEINNAQECDNQAIEYDLDYENEQSDTASVNLGDNISNEIQPRDNSFPTSTWNLSTSGAYSLDGWGNGTAEIYSSYRFKSTSGTIAYSLSNNYPNKSVTIYIYKNGSSIFNRSQLCTIPAGGVKSGLINVSSTDYIVFSFYAPCAVTGTIA